MEQQSFSFTHESQPDPLFTYNEKLSCRRETARRFVSLNILLSHSR